MTDWLACLFARLTRGREVARIRRDPFLDDPAAVEDDYRRLRQAHPADGPRAGMLRRWPKH